MVFAQNVFEKSCGAYHEKLAETTLDPSRLLGRGFRPSAGSESAYDFRKEDLIPFTVPLC